jgi:hypothetical protein
VIQGLPMLYKTKSLVLGVERLNAASCWTSSVTVISPASASWGGIAYGSLDSVLPREKHVRKVRTHDTDTFNGTWYLRPSITPWCNTQQGRG